MSASGHSRKHLLMSAAAAAVTAISPHAFAHAQQAPAAISIQSQDLDDALRLLARQTGSQIVFEPAAVKGHVAPRIENASSPEQALRGLLADSGLIYRSTGPATYTILIQATESPQPSSGAERPAPALIDDAIIVTAQRREEKLTEVPISITSFNTASMDKLGMRQIDDISRLTPSLKFQRTSGVSGNNGANISIRGVASDVGASTTAIYIDDTPIQIRNDSYFIANTYPRLFDLERVEVLKGPQGTLFGAGAEGGAVRFITPQPKFGAMTANLRTEVATTENGELSSEIGAAVGGGISDTLAFRLSGWFRNDGGYVDQINPATGAVIDEDINSQETKSARLAVTWAPNAQLSITPSLYYQKIESDGRNQFWEGYSNISGRDYKTGITTKEPENDEWWVGAVKAQYDFGTVSLISNTSYFSRSNFQTLNYANFQANILSGSQFGTFPDQDPLNSDDDLTTKQKNFVQEVRLQSFDKDQPIDWTLGLYFSSAKQDYQNLTGSGQVPGTIQFGVPQYLGTYAYYEAVSTEEKQYAAYASVDWKVTDKLKLTAGARFTKTDYDFFDEKDGPINGGVYTSDTASMEEDAFTPKFGASYQLDSDNLLYASASKGFRPGGGQLSASPVFCAADLASLGISESPTRYKSDSLWSYEAGSKNALAGGKIYVDVNAYYLKWDNIQQTVRLPSCFFSYVDNLGSATGKGVDLTLNFRPTKNLSFGGSVGFNETSYDETILGGSGVILREKGDGIGGPKWTGSAFIETNWAMGETYDAYARADYTFQSKGLAPNSNTYGFDPGLLALPSTDYLSLRFGARFAKVDVSAFVNNALNSNDPISRSNDGAGSVLYYRESYRPRTIGVTALLKY